MKNILSYLLFCFCFFSTVFSQSNNYNPDSLSIEIKNSEIEIRNPAHSIIYEKNFNNPTGFYADLDDDGLNEYLVIDSTLINDFPFFTLYVYNTLDSVYLVDSIKSGLIAPYLSNTSGDDSDSNETGKTIIISGNYLFDEFNSNKENIFLPVNCWLYENSSLFMINDEVYDFFLSENDSIINFIDVYFSSHPENCSTSEKVKAAIAAAFANYLNAGEKSIASKFLKRYYLCDDIEQFEIKVNSLIKNDLDED